MVSTGRQESLQDWGDHNLHHYGGGGGCGGGKRQEEEMEEGEEVPYIMALLGPATLIYQHHHPVFSLHALPTLIKI